MKIAENSFQNFIFSLQHIERKERAISYEKIARKYWIQADGSLKRATLFRRIIYRIFFPSFERKSFRKALKSFSDAIQHLSSDALSTFSQEDLIATMEIVKRIQKNIEKGIKQKEKAKIASSSSLFVEAILNRSHAFFSQPRMANPDAESPQKQMEEPVLEGPTTPPTPILPIPPSKPVEKDPVIEPKTDQSPISDTPLPAPPPNEPKGKELSVTEETPAKPIETQSLEIETLLNKCDKTTIEEKKSFFLEQGTVEECLEVEMIINDDMLFSYQEWEEKIKSEVEEIQKREESQILTNDLLYNFKRIYDSEKPLLFIYFYLFLPIIYCYLPEEDQYNIGIKRKEILKKMSQIANSNKPSGQMFKENLANFLKTHCSIAECIFVESEMKTDPLLQEVEWQEILQAEIFAARKKEKASAHLTELLDELNEVFTFDTPRVYPRVFSSIHLFYPQSNLPLPSPTVSREVFRENFLNKLIRKIKNLKEIEIRNQFVESTKKILKDSCTIEECFTLEEACEEEFIERNLWREIIMKKLQEAKENRFQRQEILHFFDSFQKVLSTSKPILYAHFFSLAEDVCSAVLPSERQLSGQDIRKKILSAMKKKSGGYGFAAKKFQEKIGEILKESATLEECWLIEKLDGNILDIEGWKSILQRESAMIQTHLFLSDYLDRFLENFYKIQATTKFQLYRLLFSTLKEHFSLCRIHQKSPILRGKRALFELVRNMSEKGSPPSFILQWNDAEEFEEFRVLRKTKPDLIKVIPVFGCEVGSTESEKKERLSEWVEKGTFRNLCEMISDSTSQEESRQEFHLKCKNFSIEIPALFSLYEILKEQNIAISIHWEDSELTFATKESILEISKKFDEYPNQKQTFHNMRWIFEGNLSQREAIISRMDALQDFFSFVSEKVPSASNERFTHYHFKNFVCSAQLYAMIEGIAHKRREVAHIHLDSCRLAFGNKEEIATFIDISETSICIPTFINLEIDIVREEKDPIKRFIRWFGSAKGLASFSKIVSQSLPQHNPPQRILFRLENFHFSYGNAETFEKEILHKGVEFTFDLTSCVLSELPSVSSKVPITFDRLSYLASEKISNRSITLACMKARNKKTTISPSDPLDPNLEVKVWPYSSKVEEKHFFQNRIIRLDNVFSQNQGKKQIEYTFDDETHTWTFSYSLDPLQNSSYHIIVKKNIEYQSLQDLCQLISADRVRFSFSLFGAVFEFNLDETPDVSLTINNQTLVLAEFGGLPFPWWASQERVRILFSAGKVLPLDSFLPDSPTQMDIYYCGAKKWLEISPPQKLDASKQEQQVVIHVDQDFPKGCPKDCVDAFSPILDLQTWVYQMQVVDLRAFFCLQRENLLDLSVAFQNGVSIPIEWTETTPYLVKKNCHTPLDTIFGTHLSLAQPCELLLYYCIEEKKIVASTRELQEEEQGKEKNKVLKIICDSMPSAEQMKEEYKLADGKSVQYVVELFDLLANINILQLESIQIISLSEEGEEEIISESFFGPERECTLSFEENEVIPLDTIFPLEAKERFVQCAKNTKKVMMWYNESGEEKITLLSSDPVASEDLKTSLEYKKDEEEKKEYFYTIQLFESRFYVNISQQNVELISDDFNARFDPPLDNQ